jgi:hypothetical protein
MGGGRWSGYLLSVLHLYLFSFLFKLLRWYDMM